MKVTYIDHMGNDDAVVDAARVSFDKDASMYSPEENANLIRFLARGCSKKEWSDLIQELAKATDPAVIEPLMIRLRRMADHWTPFGHCVVKLRITAPLPVRTQCFKHKQGFLENEESRRYITTPPQFFVPETLRAAAENAKQGSAGDHHRSAHFKAIMANTNAAMGEAYEWMIQEGICPEQARLVLPQSAEVTWVWTGSLYGYANFYNKRTDPHAQKETSELAQMVGDIIAPLFPVSWEALTGNSLL